MSWNSDEMCLRHVVTKRRAALVLRVFERPDRSMRFARPARARAPPAAAARGDGRAHQWRASVVVSEYARAPTPERASPRIARIVQDVWYDWHDPGRSSIRAQRARARRARDSCTRRQRARAHVESMRVRARARVCVRAMDQARAPRARARTAPAARATKRRARARTGRARSVERAVVRRARARGWRAASARPRGSLTHRARPNCGREARTAPPRIVLPRRLVRRGHLARLGASRDSSVRAVRACMHSYTGFSPAPAHSLHKKNDSCEIVKKPFLWRHNEHTRGGRLHFLSLSHLWPSQSLRGAHDELGKRAASDRAFIFRTAAAMPASDHDEALLAATSPAGLYGVRRALQRAPPSSAQNAEGFTAVAHRDGARARARARARCSATPRAPTPSQQGAVDGHRSCGRLRSTLVH